MGFSRQEYWSGLPCSLGYLPNPEIESNAGVCIAGRFFTAKPAGEPIDLVELSYIWPFSVLFCLVLNAKCGILFLSSFYRIMCYYQYPFKRYCGVIFNTILPYFYLCIRIKILSIAV